MSYRNREIKKAGMMSSVVVLCRVAVFLVEAKQWGSWPEESGRVLFTRVKHHQKRKFVSSQGVIEDVIRVDDDRVGSVC